MVDLPLWKIWKSVGMMTFSIHGKMKHVPNHQPDMLTHLQLKIHKNHTKKNNLVSVALASRSIHANCYRNVLYRPPATGFGPEVGNCCCTCLFCIHVFRVPIPAMTAISCVWKHAQNTTFIIIQPLSEGSAVFLLCFSRDPSKSKFFDSIDQTGGRGHRMQLEWSGQQCRA